MMYAAYKLNVKFKNKIKLKKKIKNKDTSKGFKKKKLNKQNDSI